MGIFSRFEILVGKQGLDKLSGSKVAVFGLGGVGSFAAESLVRSGLGNVAIVDGDVVERSNFNRQLFAIRSALGKFKVDVACDRFLEINNNVEVQKFGFFYNDKTANLINLADFDYVVDAIDDIDSKVGLVYNAFKLNVPIISAMSAGNKFSVTGFEVADLFETSVCPMARIMRKRLKDLNVNRLRVVYSKEKPLEMIVKERGVVGSVSFVPPVVGYMMAGEVVKYLLSR